MENDRKNVYAFESGLSPVSAKLIDLLKQGKEGDILTDEKMSQHCGRDTSVKGKGYSNLKTARGRTERFYGLVWERVPTAGCIKCLNSEGKMSVSENGISKVHRLTRRCKRVSELVDIDELPEEKRSQFLVTATQVGTIELMSKPSMRKKLLTRGVVKSPALDRLLESFEKIA